MKILEFTYEDAKGKVSQKRVAVTGETAIHIMGFDISKLKLEDANTLIETYIQHQKTMDHFGCTGEWPTDDETNKILKENKDDYIVLDTTPEITKVMVISKLPKRVFSDIQNERSKYLESMSQFQKVIRKYRTDRITNVHTHYRK